MNRIPAMFFDSWTAIGQSVLTGVLAYAALVMLLRVTGKRTLSKWNAFDFVVTIALGSSLATAILSQDTSLLQGVVALALLVLLQYVVTWLSVRLGWVHNLVKAEPALLVYHGRFQHDALRRERVTESEVRAALRSHGLGGVEGVAAVVLETDGTFSVIQEIEGKATSALQDVVGFEEARGQRDER